MVVDFSTNKVKVYNIDRRVDIVKGEEFALITDATADMGIRFFAENDKVLELDFKETEGTGIAKEIGTSTVTIFTKTDYQVLKELEINVVASIEQVSALNVTFGQPELKNV